MRVLVFNQEHELIGVVRESSDYDKFENAIYIDCSEGEGALRAMLNLQEQFQKRLGVLSDDTQYIKNHVLYAEAEMHEMLRELEGFKEWKTYVWTDEEKAQHKAAAKEEFIDVLHFVWNIALALGLDADEIMQIYAEKNITNHLRQDNGY